jgi:hypothetical protein
MDLQPTTTTFAVDNPGWLGSKHGTDCTRSIVLDMAGFDAEDHYPDGYVKSGISVAKKTDNGRYVPYVEGEANGVGDFAGHLYGLTKAKATGKVGAALLWHGVVVEANLPANHGLDAAAKTAAAGRLLYI